MNLFLYCLHKIKLGWVPSNEDDVKFESIYYYEYQVKTNVALFFEYFINETKKRISKLKNRNTLDWKPVFCSLSLLHVVSTILHFCYDK